MLLLPHAYARRWADWRCASTTSVPLRCPGLPAKDIIDIQVTVAALDKAVVERISAMGFVYAENIDRDHLPPGFKSRKASGANCFSTPLPVSATHTFTCVCQGRANQRYPLLFRDYFRAHPASAAAYAELKRRLAHALADPLLIRT